MIKINSKELHDKLQPHPCPCCGRAVFIGLGKLGSCQLHGDTFQSVTVGCNVRDCWLKPSVAAGDVYNGGAEEAAREAVSLWNTRVDSLSVCSSKWRG